MLQAEPRAAIGPLSWDGHDSENGVPLEELCGQFGMRDITKD